MLVQMYYFVIIQAVVFMIDSTDRKAETISKAELYNLLANEVNLHFI